MRHRTRRRIVLGLAVALVAGGFATSAHAVPWDGFEDVPPSHRFFNAIMWLRDEGITRGCNPPENTLFCPDRTVTRGQMAAMLARALALPNDAPDFFSDDDGHLFERDIDRIAAAGITRGCNPPTNDRFCPDRTVSRAELASFLVRAFGLASGAGIDWFVDDDTSVHEPAIDRLFSAGVTNGCNPPYNTRYCGERAVSRGEMAVLLQRAALYGDPGAGIALGAQLWPEPSYVFDDVALSIIVRNVREDALRNLRLWARGECAAEELLGPSVVVGDGDALLESGEVWRWVCGWWAAHVWAWLDVTASASLVDSWHSVARGMELSMGMAVPVSRELVASASIVTPGTEVAWTATLTNVAEDVRLRVPGVYLYGTGADGAMEGPDEIAGDGDAVLEPGETWQYTGSATIWDTTIARVDASLEPASGDGGLWLDVGETRVRVVGVMPT